MIRLAAVNPPGGETRVARYLETEARRYGIECEVIGDNPDRLNFVARLRGNGSKRPLLLMAHSDVVPADPSQWSVPPFSAAVRDGFIYGRGAVDTLGLLAAELSVMVELKQRGVQLSRDLILVSESDEESGSTGIRWLVRNAYPKIEAEFGLNEGGACLRLPGGTALYQIQTAEKIPTRVTLTARGTAGHASLPRADNPVVHVARALTRLADADQPVRLNATTRRYLDEISALPSYQWLQTQIPDLDQMARSGAAAAVIRSKSPEVAAILSTTVSPTMLEAGLKINVIPNAAVARVDVRRLPTESKEEILARFRQIVNDPSVEVALETGDSMPPTEPSSLTTELFKTMEEVFRAAAGGNAVVTPAMSRGATDSAFLREKGVAMYGVPVFESNLGESLAHGNNERLAIDNLSRGTGLLLEIVSRVAR
jgi:acetylornithine deacetylase/succinyl-diaminopimelate desuccinylase-like protein